MGAALVLVVSVFLACCVEAVEALTVILATGVTRDWRSSLCGAGVGVLALGILVAILGRAITHVSLGPLRILVGVVTASCGSRTAGRDRVRRTSQVHAR